MGSRLLAAPATQRTSQSGGVQPPPPGEGSEPEVSAQPAPARGVLEGALQGAVNGNLVEVGLAVNAGLGQVVEQIFNESEQSGNVARVAGVASAPAFIAAEVAEQVMKLVGIQDPNVVKSVEQLSGLGATFGLQVVPAVLSLQLAAGLLNWVGGPIDKVVDAITGELDPFNANGFVGGIVAGIGGAVKGLFGGGGAKQPSGPALGALITPREVETYMRLGVKDGSVEMLQQFERRVQALRTGADRIAVVVSGLDKDGAAPAFRLHVNDVYFHDAQVVKARTDKSEWEVFYFFPPRGWKTISVVGAGGLVAVGAVTSAGGVQDLSKSAEWRSPSQPSQTGRTLVSAGSEVRVTSNGQLAALARMELERQRAEAAQQRAVQQAQQAPVPRPAPVYVEREVLEK
ncbi:MAG TPA: hypothetical protein VK539_03130 [Myxococcaceae bacterium]|nr:hypothetical protein [Myxococcaceae bacterium]